MITNKNIRDALRENPSLGLPTRSNTNQAVQPQKMARGLKFKILDVDGLYNLYSEIRPEFFYFLVLGNF